jgi:hypothetical protein
MTDKGECHVEPSIFMFFGERKLMNHFVVDYHFIFIPCRL